MTLFQIIFQNASQQIFACLPWPTERHDIVKSKFNQKIETFTGDSFPFISVQRMSLDSFV